MLYIPGFRCLYQSRGIIVGWDLAHATGNVPLKLHDWNVDFAAWCNYKYMNGGPGVIGGLFVHERHGKVERVPTTQTNGTRTTSGDVQLSYRPRLSGWWGSDKDSRFRMENKFVPIEGASGFQLSNPSALDMTSVMASLDVFFPRPDTIIQEVRVAKMRAANKKSEKQGSWEITAEQPVLKQHGDRVITEERTRASMAHSTMAFMQYASMTSDHEAQNCAAVRGNRG